MAKWVYNFGDGKADGRAEMKNLLGGKGANLAEMASIGLPVPPGFTLTTEVCTHFYKNDCNYPKELTQQVEEALALVQQRTGRVRFVQMYSDVVLGIEINHFEKHLERAKEKRGVKQDCELLPEDLEKLVKSYKAVVQLELGEEFPEDPKAQLWGAIGAVFNSWMNQRAKTYRQLHDIPEWWGTAVNVQAMVFGNMGNDCATGVAFTRDPSTGTNEFYGEFLVNAQGEDVVAGIRTPQELTIKARKSHGSDLPSLEEVMPNIFKELLSVRSQLEHHYKDMQDIEFTIQQGKLYMLQTRNGKRTAPAALQIAVDMAKEGLITNKSPQLISESPEPTDHELHDFPFSRTVDWSHTRRTAPSDGATTHFRRPVVHNGTGETMGRIGLLFELRHAETRPGETVTVVGGQGELGAWDCYRSGVPLRTGASCYPYWAMCGAWAWQSKERLRGLASFEVSTCVGLVTRSEQEKERKGLASNRTTEARH
eukprot:g29562.t1